VSRDQSILELRVGGLPFPHGGADGEWRYRHAVRPEGPTALDHQAVSDFLSYEAVHGRHVNVSADPALSHWDNWRPPQVRPRPGAYPTQCCTHVYPRGCTDRLVCHGTPARVAAQILTSGVLRSATEVSGRAPSDLAAASPWGEPADYFEHVMFANGRCTAPEAVAYGRVLGRDLIPTVLRPGYPPAVRFYFDWEALADRSDARFDGVHPVKVYKSLPLDYLLIAVVAHHSKRVSVEEASGRFQGRLVILNIEHPSPEEWATEATAAAEAM
jgi:hypothetical protein